MTESVDYPMPMRTLRPGQRTQVWIAALDGSPVLLHTNERMLLEAPNWSPAGAALLLNGAGRLWRLDIADGRLTAIPIDDLPPINNDHVLDPDARHIYLSANDGQIYRAPIAGGVATPVTTTRPDSTSCTASAPTEQRWPTSTSRQHSTRPSAAWRS